MHELGKMHEHENDADKSNSSKVTVSNSQIKSVTTQSHTVPLNQQKIEGKIINLTKNINF